MCILCESSTLYRRWTMEVAIKYDNQKISRLLRIANNSRHGDDTTSGVDVLDYDEANNIGKFRMQAFNAALKGAHLGYLDLEVDQDDCKCSFKEFKEALKYSELTDITLTTKVCRRYSISVEMQKMCKDREVIHREYRKSEYCRKGAPMIFENECGNKLRVQA